MNIDVIGTDIIVNKDMGLRVREASVSADEEDVVFGVGQKTDLRDG